MVRCVLASMLVVSGASACDDAEASEQTGAQQARDYRSRPVEQALDSASRAVRTRGFARDGETWRGFLVHQDSETVDVSMQAEHCHVIVAASSSGIDEIDLRVFDSGGGEVAKDSHSGRLTALHYCPAQTGVYYVAARATSGNGLFAVRRFRGPNGLDVELGELFRAQRNEPQAEQP